MGKESTTPQYTSLSSTFISYFPPFSPQSNSFSSHSCQHIFDRKTFVAVYVVCVCCVHTVHYMHVCLWCECLKYPT